MGKQHILLLGPTGSGKTFTVKTLTEYLGFPLSFASATALVETGWVDGPSTTPSASAPVPAVYNA